MNIGLYRLKYPARKALLCLLPYLSTVSPNAISLLQIPVGIVMALCCLYHYFLTAAFIAVVRMFLATLDGLVALHYNKQSATGEIVNRLAPELGDILFLSALAIQYPLLGIGALAVAWLTTFSGLVGQEIQSVGPVGQTDRLVAFIICAFFAKGIPLFLWWCMIGGIVTVANRLYRTLA